MIAAPFLGEFGWLVALWVPWLRGMRKHYEDKDEFIVYCQKGHRVFFEDFASTVVEIDRPLGITKIDCQLAWLYGVQMRREDYMDLVSHTIGEWHVSRNKLITPLDMKYTWSGDSPPLPTKRAIYRKFGEANPFANRIAIHARACKNKQPGRNWSEWNWKNFIHDIGPIGRHFAFVGSKEDSLFVEHPQTEDMRGVPMKELTDILASCGRIVGPSSGPLHLANHCGTPAVWWSGDAKNIERYKTAWNPFGVKNVCVANDTWQPGVDAVIEAVE